MAKQYKTQDITDGVTFLDFSTIQTMAMLLAMMIVIVIVYLFHRSLWLNSAIGCRTCQRT
jgi:hypothetical protein